MGQQYAILNIKYINCITGLGTVLSMKELQSILHHSCTKVPKSHRKLFSKQG